ncbi:hypothetical protein C8F01DRAFT_1089395 [Mycena amicta]|nr:hypothetical protein C8F01DRAFT_1089395 [Mycena amicta]
MFRSHLSLSLCIVAAALVTAGPCDIYASGGTPCVAAHSTTRALFDAYTGSLYQLKRGSDGATTNIAPLSAGGVANAATQDSFCSGTTCVITTIFAPPLRVFFHNLTVRRDTMNIPPSPVSSSDGGFYYPAPYGTHPVLPTNDTSSSSIAHALIPVSATRSTLIARPPTPNNAANRGHTFTFPEGYSEPVRSGSFLSGTSSPTVSHAQQAAAAAYSRLVSKQGPSHWFPILLSGIGVGLHILFGSARKRGRRWRAGQDGRNASSTWCITPTPPRLYIYLHLFFWFWGGDDESGRGQKGLVIVYSAQKAAQSKQGKTAAECVLGKRDGTLEPSGIVRDELQEKKRTSRLQPSASRENNVELDAVLSPVRHAWQDAARHYITPRILAPSAKIDLRQGMANTSSLSYKKVKEVTGQLVGHLVGHLVGRWQAIGSRP